MIYLSLSFNLPINHDSCFTIIYVYWNYNKACQIFLFPTDQIKLKLKNHVCIGMYPNIPIRRHTIKLFLCVCCIILILELYQLWIRSGWCIIFWCNGVAMVHHAPLPPRTSALRSSSGLLAGSNQFQNPMPTAESKAWTRISIQIF